MTATISATSEGVCYVGPGRYRRAAFEHAARMTRGEAFSPVTVATHVAEYLVSSGVPCVLRLVST